LDIKLLELLPPIEVRADIETELLDPFFNIGGFIMLSLDDDDLLLGSEFSISITFLLMQAASGQCWKYGEIMEIKILNK
jgi:hypothetical protein